MKLISRRRSGDVVYCPAISITRLSIFLFSNRIIVFLLLSQIIQTNILLLFLLLSPASLRDKPLTYFFPRFYCSKLFRLYLSLSDTSQGVTTRTFSEDKLNLSMQQKHRINFVNITLDDVYVI